MTEPKQPSDLADKVRQVYLQHEAESHPEQQLQGEAPVAESSPEPNAGAEGAHESTTDELARLQQQYNELNDRYLRLAADFDNYRKRMLRERETWAEAMTEHLLRQLLPIVDQLHMALEADSSSPETLRQGVELIYRNLLKLLEQLGVQPIAVSPGQPFDVHYHEAILRVPSELPEGTVVKEVQRGYLLRDRVLRHSRVIVSAGQHDDHSRGESPSESQA